MSTLANRCSLARASVHRPVPEFMYIDLLRQGRNTVLVTVDYIYVLATCGASYDPHVWVRFSQSDLINQTSPRLTLAIGSVTCPPKTGPTDINRTSPKSDLTKVAIGRCQERAPVIPCA